MARKVLLGAAAVGAAVVVAKRRRIVEELHHLDHPFHSDDLDGTEHLVLSHDGAELVVHVTGPEDGPTVVLAHCWTGSQRTWAPVARRLVAAGCRVVRWDQRGHGRSSSGHKGHTVEALADDLQCVLTELDLHDVVVAGHSMGGMTIQSYAAHHHDDFHARVRAAVLVATAGFGLRRSPVANQSHLVGIAALERWMARPAVGRAFVRGTFGRAAHPAHLDATAIDFISTPGHVRAEFIASLADLDLREGVARIDVPTTIICGSRDTLTPLPLSKALHGTIPGSVLEVLPGYGHMLVYEAPDVVADAVLAHALAGAPEATTA